MPLLTINELLERLEKYGDHPRETAIATIAMNAAMLQAAVHLQAADTMSKSQLEAARYEDDKRPRQPDEHRWAGHGDTELYLDCPNVDGAYSHLRAAGCPVEEPKSTHYGMKQVWVTDPDGFKLCFQSPSKNDEA